MRKIFLFSMMLVVASFIFTACEPAANTSTANKAANTTNTTGNSMTNTAAAGNPEAEIKKLMGDLAAALAKNDADGAAKFYADDYHLVTPAGVDQTKAERIADMKSGKSKFESFEYSDINVRSYGDTAVAICMVKIKGTVSGQPSPPEARATLVFNKTKDGWKVVSGQATPITAAAKTEDKKEGDDKKMEANKSTAAPANK